MPHHHTATVVQRPGQQTWPSKEFPIHPDGVLFGMLLILSWLINVIQWIRSIKVRRPPTRAHRRLLPPPGWTAPDRTEGDFWRN
jgi:hypothetical protein